LSRKLIHIIKILFTLVLIHLGSKTYGQTCCSGGIPLSTNLEFDIEEVNTLHIALSSDFNRLNTLYNVSETLPLNNRRRKTNSYLFRGGYDFAHGTSFEVLAPYIVQHRYISKNNGGNDNQRSSGIGDIVSSLIIHFHASGVSLLLIDCEASKVTLSGLAPYI
jgi:hypothetical protein